MRFLTSISHFLINKGEPQKKAYRCCDGLFVLRSRRREACFEARGTRGKRVPSGHLHEVQSDPQVGAFTEYGDRMRELYDNKSEWARDGMNGRWLFLWNIKDSAYNL